MNKYVAVLKERSFAQKTTLFSFFWEENITKRGGKLNSASFIMYVFVDSYASLPLSEEWQCSNKFVHYSCCAAY